MRWPCPVRSAPRLAVAAAVVFTGSVLTASDGVKGVGQFNPQDETVELFSAIEEGKLEVKLIPKDSSQCRVLITNKTEKPLNVSLPDAFAGVPVLAQLQFQPAGANNFNNFNNQNNAPQRVGVGNQFGNNLFQGNQGNQLFNIAPEKVAQLKLTSVCLDHGLPNPRPAMPYEIRPIASVTDKAEVYELCRMLGGGQVSQRAAQAAAWHLNNEMSWDQLAGLRLKLALGSITQPFFTPKELAEGKKAAEAAVGLVEKRQQAAVRDASYKEG